MAARVPQGNRSEARATRDAWKVGSARPITRRPGATQTQWGTRRLRSRNNRCVEASSGQGVGDVLQVVVVGGGVGGLAVAGRLAAQGGFNVSLVEKNAEIGGRLQSMKMDGCRFDTGPSLLLFKDKYQEAFEAMGARLEDYADVRRVGPAAYRVFFGDCTSLDLLYDVQAMFEQLEAEELGAGGNFLRFLSDSRAALELGTANFIEKDFDNLTEFLDLEKMLPLLRYLSIPELLAPHDTRMARRFKDPRLRALFTFQDLYVGLSPYTAPGVFSLLAATELTDGVWYPCGGFGKIRDGLAHAAESRGVKILRGREVTNILVKDGAVQGVAMEDGAEISADVVICNCDVASGFELVDSDKGRQRAADVDAMDYSAGVIAFNWSVEREVDSSGRCKLDMLQHHNVFLSENFKESWNRARSASELQRDPNFYVHVPARTDPSAAESGKDSLMVLLPVANIQERGGNADYSELVVAGREAVLMSLMRAGVGDTRSAIRAERVIEPREWRERYGLRHGAAFGLSHGLGQLAVFRPPVNDTATRGLYFCGASCRPGNGVPLVLIGSRLTAERILKDVHDGRLNAV